MSMNYKSTTKALCPTKRGLRFLKKRVNRVPVCTTLLMQVASISSCSEPMLITTEAVSVPSFPGIILLEFRMRKCEAAFLSSTNLKIFVHFHVFFPGVGILCLDTLFILEY